MDRIKGKVTLVTGGALGIGRAICLLFAKEGAVVAVTDILAEEGKQVIGQIQGQGGVAEFWHLDVTNEADVQRAFSEVRHRFGAIDVLVNNDGISGADKPTHEITVEEWERVMAVNVKGVFLCAKHAIPYMREAGGGSIINLSSIYGIVGAPDVPPYHASKGAVRLMTKTDALLYAKDRIRVNSIHPGFIATPLVDDLAQRSSDGAEEYRKHLDSLHPLGHIGEPDDVAYGACTWRRTNRSS